MKTTHSSATHRAHPSSVPERPWKLAGGVSHRNIPECGTAPAGAAEDSSTPAGVRSVAVLFRWLRSFLAPPPANFLRPSGTLTAPHRTALAWLGALLLTMTLGLSDAAAYSRIFTLWLENGTSAPVSFTVRAVSCWDGTGVFWAPYFDANGNAVLGPVAPGQKVSMTVARTQGHGCDGEQGKFTITPSTSTEAQGFEFDNGGSLAMQYYANRFHGVLSAKSAVDESYTWTLKPLEARLSGPLDERLTMPRNQIARNYGKWDGGPEDGGNVIASPLKFRRNGFKGMSYSECDLFALMHAQHVVRLRNKNGKAYFIVSNSDVYLPGGGFYGYPNGRISVYRSDAVDPATGLVVDQPGTDGQIVWEQEFGTQYSLGAWNHPCKMELIGDLLLISMLDWKGPIGCYTGYQRAVGAQMAVLFYDVRDPENPKFWGRMTNSELEIGDVEDVSLVHIDDRWFLHAGNRWWHNRYVSPNLKDWTFGGTGNPGGNLQGQYFNSYELYNPGEVPANTRDAGTERVMWGNGEGYDDDNGDHVAGNESVTFSELDFDGGVWGHRNTVYRAAPNLWSFTFDFGEYHSKDYDAACVTVCNGMPVFYSPFIYYRGGGHQGNPFGSTPDDWIYQIYNPENFGLVTPHPDQVVTSLLDSGPGSLRRAIGKGGNITFDASLNGRTINLTSGPLVAYPYNATIDATCLQCTPDKGITIKTLDGGPAFMVPTGRDVNVTTSGLNFPAFTTSDTGTWFGQTATSYSGGSRPDALQSGNIGATQETTLSTKVTGPGTLTFWWKVSSETNYDFLRFRLDFAQVAAAPEISGEVGWQQKTIAIPAGNHTLEWTYSKDVNASAGSDAGWVDEVVFTPAKPKIEVSNQFGGSLARGSVVGWGDNTYGQATAPPGLGGVNAIAAGYFHTVALKSDKTVVTWGNNFYGQLNVPNGLTGVIAIAAGHGHTLAVKSDGMVVGWGDNQYGQRDGPAGLSGVIAITAGVGHTVALKSDGTVVAWGNNFYGQTNVPAGLSGVIAIAAGDYHTVALKSNGVPVAWGRNENGQCDVDGLDFYGVFAIAAGQAHSVALLNGGGMVILSGNGLSTAGVDAAIAAGGDQVLGLNLDGSVQAQDVNGNPQTTVPPGLFGVTAIAAGNSHAVAVVDKSPTIDFGTRNVGSAGAPKTFYVRNRGAAPLTVSSVVTTSGNAGDFTVSSFTPGSVVAPGSFTPFTVTFNPTAGGPRTTTLRVVSNDADEGTFDIPLTGTGIGTFVPEIAIEQPGGTSLGKVSAWGDNNAGQTNVPAGLSGAIAVATGSGQSVALRSDGSVLAWGDNTYGQGTVPSSALSGVIAIGAGYAHNVALRNDGTVVAWGANGLGQVTGTPTTTAPYPVIASPVTPGGQVLSGVTAIAAGFAHNLAISNGKVVAWGNNVSGQTTVPAAALSGVIAIAVGNYHSLAVKSDGSVLAWGENSFGQTTVPAAALSGVSAVAAGLYHSVALKGGTVLAWGDADAGLPVPVAAQSGVIAIAAGDYHTVALKSDGTVVAWGLGYNGSTTVPPGLTGVSAIAAGGFATLALVARPTIDFGNQTTGTTSAAKTFTIKNTGTATLVISSVTFTAGLGNPGDFARNTTGMLTSLAPGGQTSFTVTFTPTALGARTATLSVLSNDPGEGTFNLTLTGTGTGTVVPQIALDLPPGTPRVGNVVAWGNNSGGQATVPVAAQSGVSGIAAGYVHSVALKPDGTVIAWGGNQYGATNVPAGLNGVTAIAAGYWHSVALKSDGTVRTWGYGTENTVPAGLTGVRAISGGNGGFTVALKTDGSVVAWGDNSAGQTTVPGAALSGVTAIAAGSSHAVALKSDGRVVAWGDNSAGQTTVPGAALSGVTAIAADGGHTVALKSEGSVLAWGSNNGGQTTVPAAAQSGVIAIAAGDLNTIALKSDGSVVTWGYGGFGFNTVPAGAQSGVVAIAGGLHALALVGTPTVDFGNKILGTPGVTKTFTIRSTGNSPLSITSVGTTGGNSSDFTVTTSILPASIAAGAQTNVIVTFNPTTPGLRTTTLRVLSNDATKGTIDVALTGRLLTAIQSWRQIYFGSIANSGNGADLNDYKKDGKVNLLKYAFGLNPTLSNVGQIPQPQKVGTDFVASFTQPSGVSGITYGAEWSTTLQAGSWTPIPDTGSGAQHTFSLAIGTMPRLFMRLKVTDLGTPISLAGAVATQSSGYGADGYPAANAIDGDPYSFTATGNTDPAPTWTLTLPVATEIGSIVLSNRLGCCWERLRNITVRVFSDAAGTVPVFTSAVLNPNNVLNGPPTLSVSPGGVTGRVIRVSRGLSDNPFDDDRLLTLGEVQLTSP